VFRHPPETRHGDSVVFPHASPSGQGHPIPNRFTERLSRVGRGDCRRHGRKERQRGGNNAGVDRWLFAPLRPCVAVSRRSRTGSRFATALPAPDRPSCHGRRISAARGLLRFRDPPGLLCSGMIRTSSLPGPCAWRFLIPANKRAPGRSALCLWRCSLVAVSLLPGFSAPRKQPLLFRQSRNPAGSPSTSSHPICPPKRC
jgi:hypothetical protein